MRRVIVTGGAGFFGRAALDLLRDYGIAGIAASRRQNTELTIDVEDRASLARALQAGDIVIDTVGPFQDRSTALIDAAMAIGCDVIDISDSLDYAQRVDRLQEKAAGAGIHVFSSCSSVSVLSAMLVAASGISEPKSVRGFLIPSARYSASAATADSLLRSVGQNVRVWRDGRLQETAGWSASAPVTFPRPIGMIRGHLFESADSFWLPRVWFSLQSVELTIDTRVPGLNAMLSLAARSPAWRRLIERFQTLGHGLARRIGRRDGGLAVEIRAADGTVSQRAIYCPDRGYRLAVLPAVLAAQSLLSNTAPPPGIVPPHLQLAADDLIRAIERLGFSLLSAPTATPAGDR